MASAVRPTSLSSQLYHAPPPEDAERTQAVPERKPPWKPSSVQRQPLKEKKPRKKEAEPVPSKKKKKEEEETSAERRFVWK